MSLEKISIDKVGRYGIINGRQVEQTIYKAYDVGNRLEWLKTSIDFARDDKESKEGLIEYMEIFIKN